MFTPLSESHVIIIIPLIFSINIDLNRFISCNLIIIHIAEKKFFYVRCQEETIKIELISILLSQVKATCTVYEPARYVSNSRPSIQQGSERTQTVKGSYYT